MKYRHHFTLVELLVVIAIIVILAGMILGAVNMAITKAERAKATADMSAIVPAIRQYEATYHRIPKHDDYCDSNGVVKTDAHREAFYKMLQGEVKTTGNPRGLKLLSIKPEGPGKFIDPWDGEYVIYLDINNDGKITESIPGISNNTIYLPAAVYSCGPDGDESTASDNVYSFPTEADGNKFKVTN